MVCPGPATCPSTDPLRSHVTSLMPGQTPVPARNPSVDADGPGYCGTMTSASQAAGDDKPGLTIDTHTTDDDTVTLRCSGELDHTTSRLLRQRGAEAIDTGAATVVVDLEQVDFVDSAGLGTLVEIHKHLREEQREMVLRTSRPSTLSLLRTTGMDGYFTVRRD